MDSISGTRRPCFIEEDNGLASIAGMEAGFSGYTKNDNPFFSRPLCYGRRGNLRFYDAKFEQKQHVPHFLESCFLCNKSLSDNKDIFMYRGDTPFCSEECRQEQIEIDEAKEKKWNLSNMKTLREKDQKKSSISAAKARNYPSRAGTVAAA